MKKIAVLLGFLMIFTLIAPVVSQASAPTNVTINYNSVRLRQGPGTNYPIITSVNKGSTFKYLATSAKDSAGYAWYKIQYNSSTVAFVRSDLATGNTTSTPTAPTTTTNQKELGKIQITSTDGLNVRSSRSTSSTLLTTIPYGATVGYTELTNRWYKVTYNGKTGYVFNYYTKVVSQIAPVTTGNEKVAGTIQITSSDGLNVRSSASTSSALLITIPYGKTAEYYSLSGSWYKVTYGGKVGFVHKYYTKVVNSSSTPQPIVSPPAPTTEAKGSVRITANLGLRLRSQPSTSSTQLAVIPGGTIVKLYDENATWYKVVYSGKTGWIYKAYAVKLSSDETNAGGPTTNRQEAWLSWATGRFLDPDGNGVSWCTDTINQYALDLFGQYRGIGNGGNARDLMEVTSSSYFQKIYYDPNNPATYPKRGDIAVWGGSYSNPAGHVGIVVEDVKEAYGTMKVLHSAHNFSPYDATAISNRAYRYSSGTLRGVLRPITSKITATHRFGTK